jgi:hypothetical protein
MSYADILKSIAATVADYREGEIAKPSPEHVDKWASQFDKAVREPLLTELDHVLKRTYIPRANVVDFLKTVLSDKKLASEKPCDFWKGVGILDIQKGGESQKEMVAMFSAIMKKTCRYDASVCKAGNGTFIYLDDVVFTGNRVLNDLRDWIAGAAPNTAHVHIVTMAYHRNGKWYAGNELTKAAKAAKKDISRTWWRFIELEDRKSEVNTSDVLRPRALPGDADVKAYAETFSNDYPIAFRTADSVGEHKFFSSENGRALLEQELLRAGVHIRKICPKLGENQRPLGNMVLKSLGFGSMIVTFRNCPNNTPLAFWAGDPWYPLFPRKVNKKKSNFDAMLDDMPF